MSRVYQTVLPGCKKVFGEGLRNSPAQPGGGRAGEGYCESALCQAGCPRGYGADYPFGQRRVLPEWRRLRPKVAAAYIYGGGLRCGPYRGMDKSPSVWFCCFISGPKA